MTRVPRQPWSFTSLSELDDRIPCCRYACSPRRATRQSSCFLTSSWFVSLNAWILCSLDVSLHSYSCGPFARTWTLRSSSISTLTTQRPPCHLESLQPLQSLFEWPAWEVRASRRHSRVFHRGPARCWKPCPEGKPIDWKLTLVMSNKWRVWTYIFLISIQGIFHKKVSVGSLVEPDVNCARLPYLIGD